MLKQRAWQNVTVRETELRAAFVARGVDEHPKSMLWYRYIDNSVQVHKHWTADEVVAQVVRDREARAAYAEWARILDGRA